MNALEYFAAAELYGNIYNFSFFFVCAVTAIWLAAQTKKVTPLGFTPPNQIIVYALVALAIYLIGTFPYPLGLYGDRECYVLTFDYAKFNPELFMPDSGDKLFNYYILACSKIMESDQWLFLTGLIYVINYVLFCRKVGGKYAPILILAFLYAFQFFSYGVNTMRAGLAASFLLLAIAYNKSKFKMALFLLIAVNIHFSMIIPAIGLLVSIFYYKPRFFYALWFFSILLSAAAGSYFESIFADMSIDDRVDYLSVDADDTAYNFGFRIDFIIYSCLPIITGYYYITKKNFNDSLYQAIYGTYLLANMFWILVIRANFSDRFAYLSWFLYPAVLIYPLIKKRMFENQNNVIAAALLFIASFNFAMAVMK